MTKEFGGDVVVKEVYDCCRVVLHRNCGKVGPFFISLDEDFSSDPRLYYDCLIRAIGDALIDAGVEV